MAAPASARALVLAALLMQNVGYTLLRRYSQGVLHEQYSFSELLLLAELVKLVVAACVTAGDDAPSDAPSGQPLRKIAWLAANSGKMLVLAAIYGGMNLLSFVAIRRITAAAFTVCAQLKILTTAACSVVFLQRKLSLTKWRALVTLALGATLVSLGTLSLPCDARRVGRRRRRRRPAGAGAGAAVLARRGPPRGDALGLRVGLLRGRDQALAAEPLDLGPQLPARAPLALAVRHHDRDRARPRGRRRRGGAEVARRPPRRGSRASRSSRCCSCCSARAAGCSSRSR